MHHFLFFEDNNGDEMDEILIRQKVRKLLYCIINNKNAKERSIVLLATTMTKDNWS